MKGRPASSRPKPATTASITTAASSSTADQQASGGRSQRGGAPPVRRPSRRMRARGPCRLDPSARAAGGRQPLRARCMSEDAPELTAELVVDGVVPSQPVISPDGCWVAYVVAPAARQRVECARYGWPPLTCSAAGEAERHHPDRQPHRPGRALPARTRDQRPPQRAHLARHRPGPGHQPRRSPPRYDPDSPVADGHGPTAPETAKAGPLQVSCR